MSESLQKLNIPIPDAKLFDVSHPYLTTLPCKELNEFLEMTILEENHFLFNLDHIHLSQARIGFLFASVSNSKLGKQVLGTCEEAVFRCGKWQRARQEQQIYEWFGLIPDFIITFDASFWIDRIMEKDYASILALFEHELYHAGQKYDEFGMPKFSKETGKPQFALAPHSIEEHTGVIRRYGAEASGQDRVDFINAALGTPEIAPAQIRAACGACG